MDLHRDGYHDDAADILRLQHWTACRNEDHDFRQVTDTQPDLPLLLFSDAYAISGFLLGFSFLVIVPPATWGLHVWLAAFSAALGGVTLLFSWQSHRRRELRQRIYRLLVRRIVGKGFRQEDFRHLCGGPCLRFQHRLLFLRFGIYREYYPTMRRFKKTPLVYFGHPNVELEEELNFGASADRMRDQLGSADGA